MKAKSIGCCQHHLPERNPDRHCGSCWPVRLVHDLGILSAKDVHATNVMPVQIESVRGTIIEGACRNLINDRLALTGMRWTFQGAESVIPLRAV